MSAHLLSPTDRIERRLLILAGAFLVVYSLALSLSDPARLRSWQVDYRWQHWLGLASWIWMAVLAHITVSRLLPERDPFILPIAALLSGWGLLTIWRLSTGFGVRQSAWLLVIGLFSLLVCRTQHSTSGEKILLTLRRYKYVWLTFGLLLTAATLLLGTNPMGAGPQLWLGCCGIYIQPSEPLKLLLIVYLAAYLADRLATTTPAPRLLPMLIPTLIMTGLTMLLLIFQRDLGTAAIFLALYAVIVFAGTNDRRILIFSLLALILASVVGYSIFDVVNQRMAAWINPWVDPSGRSYQVVQSLLSIANGGLVGRGPGMGSPGLVPIAQSDFIFSAISEESGLLGAAALLGLLALLVNRGTRIALQSADPFHRLLSIGLVVHLVGQSILIIAGNVRLLPLTGVTLPFVSYGGSSLMVSFFELLCLLLISNHREQAIILQPDKLKAHTRTSLFFSTGLLLGLAGVAVVTGWWSVVRAPDLLTRTDNPRRSIADRYVRRGSILDRHEVPLAESTGQSGSFLRQYPYSNLGPIIGYTHPAYGQAGLESSLDAYLRGLQGHPGITNWWENLLYGYPPSGLDVRLSIDLDLQTRADQLFAGDPGSLVLLNAQNGEVLTITSSPSFDANTLDTTWETLIKDPASPLFDRAGMGLYPPGNSLAVFLLAASGQEFAGTPASMDYPDCALRPSQPTLEAMIAAGCPQPISTLLQNITNDDLITLLDGLGLFTAPTFPIETLSSSRPAEISSAASYLTGETDTLAGASLRLSPLQMALAAAALTNQGELPALRLVTGYEVPQTGWNAPPATTQPHQVFSVQSANEAAQALAISDFPIWEVVTTAKANDDLPDAANPGYSWYVGGTLPDWKGVPVAIAVLLENDDPSRVQQMGRSMLLSVIHP